MSEAFARDLAEVINRHSVENASDTPDIVLGAFLADCLDAFDTAVNSRAALAARSDEPGVVREFVFHAYREDDDGFWDGNEIYADESTARAESERYYAEEEYGHPEGALAGTFSWHAVAGVRWELYDGGRNTNITVARRRVVGSLATEAEPVPCCPGAQPNHPCGCDCGYCLCVCGCAVCAEVDARRAP